MAEHIQYLAFWTPGPMELVIILIVAVLVFGKRLPDIARGLGKSMTEFKKGLREVEETKKDVEKDVRQFKNDVAKETREAAVNDNFNTD